MNRVMFEHLDKLCMPDERHYLQWCDENGFDPHMEKTATQCKKELRAYLTLREQLFKKRKNMRGFIKNPSPF